MCGRFALYAPVKKIKAQFNVAELPSILPRYNIAPSQEVLILIQGPQDALRGELFTWGLIPFFTKDKTTAHTLINARADTVNTKPAFRQAFKAKRGLIVMSGFFEWHTENGKKQPYYISSKDNSLLAIAALWDTCLSPTGETIHSCCMITTSANSFMEKIHHRMPVILNHEAQAIWLDNTLFNQPLLTSLIQTISEENLQLFPVTPKMSHWRFNEKLAIQPLQ